MNVKLSVKFLEDLSDQIEYISQDKPAAAQKFKADLFKLFESLPDMPFKNRKSIYFEDDSIRDLIFKGYRITYKVDKNQIAVFGFTKYQEKI